MGGKNKVLEHEQDERNLGVCSGNTQNGEIPLMLMLIGLNC